MKIRSIKANAILNIIYTLINLLFPLITYPYVLRVLSVSGFGRVNFYTAVASYATMIAALGLSTYGVRAVAKVRDNEKELRATVSELLTINLAATLVVLFVYINLVLWIGTFGRDIPLAVINGILIATTPLGMNWFFSGLEQYGYITKRQLFFKLLSLVMIFLFVKDEGDYVVYAGIIIFSSVGAFICNVIYAMRIVHFSIFTKGNYQRHFKSMLIMFASALAISVYLNLDTVMLGIIRDDWEVGIYTTAVKIRTVLLQIINAISVVLLPRLSFYIQKDERNEYNRILKKSIAINFMLTIPLAVFFIIYSMQSILIIGGSDYMEASLCMKILMPILIISGFSNVLGNQVLIPQGKEICFMKAVATGAVIDIILNLIFMPKYGSAGAATATLAAEMTQMSIQVYYSWEYIKDNIHIASIIKVVSCVFITSVLSLLLKMPQDLNTLIALAAEAIIFFGIYGLELLILKDEYAWEIVNSGLSKIRR